jgi:hypothetical protein
MTIIAFPPPVINKPRSDSEGAIEPNEKTRDQDRGKGATEQDPQNEGGNTNLQGQLGHRDEDVELKNSDSNLSG